MIHFQEGRVHNGIFRCALFLFIIPYSDIIPRLAEGIPRDVEPAVASQELVGIGADAKEVDKALELLRVFGADVSGLTKEVLRALDTTNEAVDAGRTEAGVDEDGTNKLASGLQEHQAAIDHVHHVLHGGLIVGILAQIKELAKLKVITELCVFHG